MRCENFVDSIVIKKEHTHSPETDFIVNISKRQEIICLSNTTYDNSSSSINKMFAGEPVDVILSRGSQQILFVLIQRSRKRLTQSNVLFDSGFKLTPEDVTTIRQNCFHVLSSSNHPNIRIVKNVCHGNQFHRLPIQKEKMKFSGKILIFK